MDDDREAGSDDSVVDVAFLQANNFIRVVETAHVDHAYPLAWGSMSPNRMSTILLPPSSVCTDNCDTG